MPDDKARQITVPRGPYKLRVKDAERGISQLKTDEQGNQKGNNPMITLDLEIIDAAPVQVKNPETGEVEAIDINGLEVRQWVTLTEKALGPANTIKASLGMDKATKETLTTEDSGLYMGKVGYAILEGKQRNIKDASGANIINPHTNKPVTVPELKLVMWLSPS